MSAATIEKKAWLTGLVVALNVATAQADDSCNIRLATTTSTVNSGLMDILIPEFEANSNCSIILFVSGTGKALRNARVGQADVVIVHAPKAEQKFIDQGHGVARLPLMKNEFVLLGPATDPAEVVSLQDSIAAFKQIADKKAPFVSRGDDSGTHKKELSIWALAGIEPYADWYLEVGKGMADTLRFANQNNAYVMVDSSTWLAMRKRLELKLLLKGDSNLVNPYSVIAVNPGKHASVNKKAADVFIAWMLSPQAARLISDYKVDGEQLFYLPDV